MTVARLGQLIPGQARLGVGQSGIRIDIETDLVIEAEASAFLIDRYRLDWNTQNHGNGPITVTAEALDEFGAVIESIDRTFEIANADVLVQIDSDLVLDAEASAEIPTSITVESDFVLDAEASIEIPTSIDIETDLTLDADVVAQATAVVESIESDIVLDAETSANVEVLREPYFGLRLDIGPLQEDPVATIAPVISASYRMAVGEISEWSAQLPPAGANVDLVRDGMEIRLIRDGEGELIRGVINNHDYEITENGLVLNVEGEGVERELVWGNTLRRDIASEPVNDAITFITGIGWSLGDVSTSGEVTGRFEWVSQWEAIRAIADSQSMHLRARPVAREIDIGDLGDERSIRFIGVETVHQDYDRETVPVKSMTLKRSSPDVWTRVIPLGGGDDVNVLTLEHSTRSSPFVIQSATGPSFQQFHYLWDEDAIAEYGLRTKVIKFDEVTPLSNSFAEVVRAANALYDLATSWLQHRAHRKETWEIQVPSFRHRNPLSGEYTILPGDRARLRYRGIATAMDGRRRLWADVDEMAWCRSLERAFNADGGDDWSLELSSSLKQVDDDEVLAETVSNMWAMQTSVKHSVIETQAGPVHDSIDDGFPVEVDVIYDQNIRYLHLVKLDVRRSAIRADARGAEAGGGQTTSAGGGQTTSAGGETTETTNSGGGQTTSSGGATTETTDSGGGTFTTTEEESVADIHRHVLFNAHATTTWSEPAFIQTWEGQRLGGQGYGGQVGRGSTDSGTNLWSYAASGSAHDHNLNLDDHSHSVSIPNHTHSVDDHTHSVDIPSHTHSVDDHAHSVDDHTHDLNYGIFEGDLPDNPQFEVWINNTDRTSELGGPFNDDEFTVDITEFLVDSQGYVNQERNTIEIRAANLQRARVTVRSICTIASTVPVG